MSLRTDFRAPVLALCLAAAMVHREPKAHARTRLGVVQGRIILPSSARACPVAPKAYWRFTVPNVTPPTCVPRLSGYLVTLDEWDPKAARRMWRRVTKGGSAPRMRIYGVSFVPQLVLVPKEEQSYQVIFTNQDRFVHEIFSPDKKGDDGQVVAPDGSVTETFDGLNPLASGEAQFFRMRCRRFPHMRGAVVFVRSTALAVPGAGGSFRVRVSQGDHVLRVWHDGKMVALRKVVVGRRPVSVLVDLRSSKTGTSRARRAAVSGKQADGAGSATHRRPSRRRHHGRRRRSRRRKRRRR